MHKSSTSKGASTLPFILSSILITFLLFYIDEGNYNFEWMLEPGSWVVFFIYAFPLYLTQVLFSKVIVKPQKGWENTFLSIIIGSITGLTFVMGVVFGVG